VTTALTVWLGVIVDRAREQREAVKAIEALGGEIYYDWQVQVSPIAAAGPLAPNPNAKPRVPAWLRRIVGDHFFASWRLARLSGRLGIEVESRPAELLCLLRYTGAVTVSFRAGYWALNWAARFARRLCGFATLAPDNSLRYSPKD
jgi:hypothetical protein